MRHAADSINIKVRIQFTLYINHGKYYNATIKNVIYPHFNVHCILQHYANTKTLKGQSHKNGMSTTVHIFSVL